MYAFISSRWVEEGCFIHVMTNLSHDGPGNDALKWLGFGLSTVDAVRECSPIKGACEDTIIRQASLEDLKELASLGLSLEQHLKDAPSFWIEEHKDYGEWVREPGNCAWLAYQGNDVQGFIALEPGENCECMFMQDEKTIYIVGAFTLKKARSKGIATTILNEAMQWAQHEGYTRCAVDFEAMNVLASRFWFRYFEPVSYSWIRWIDERLRR